MMAIRQLHYTSLASGPDGRRGFQVSAATPGIPRALEDASIKASAYRAPSNPSSSAPEEIDRLPVSLGYARPGGGTMLYQSRYVGHDFAGRQGNYFAHALLTDEGADALEDLRPIETWRARFWRSAPEPVTALPPLRHLEPGGLTDLRSVHRFLHAGRLPMLPAVVDAVRRALVDPRERVVLVCPDSDAAALWIAAVTHALPHHLALAVTFTTFSATPLDEEALLIGTVPGVPIPRDPFRPQAVLDLTSSQSEGPGAPYATAVAEGWRRSSSGVRELVRLGERAAPPVRATELDVLADVHHLVEGFAVPVERTAAALIFGAERLDDQVLRDALETTARFVIRDGPLPNRGEWAQVIDRAARGGVDVPPSVTDTYARALLTAVADGAPAPTASLSAPVRASLARVAGSWARARFHQDSSLDTAVSALAALLALRVRVTGDQLAELEDYLVVPTLLSDPSDATAAIVMTWPEKDALLADVCRRIDEALAEPRSPWHELAVSIPPPAARLLQAHIAPGTPLGETVVKALVNAGDLEPVKGLSRLLSSRDTASPRDVERLVELLWDEPPSAGDGAALLRRLDGATVARTALPDLLVQRLLEDAAREALTPQDAELAAELAREPIGAALGAGRPTVDAITLGAYLRGRPADTRRATDAALDAMALTARVGEDVSEWLLHTAADWVIGIEDPVEHAEALLALSRAAPAAFFDVHRKRAQRRMVAAPPRRLAEVLPGWAALAAEGGDGRLLEVALPAVVKERRRRDLDEVGRHLQRIAVDLQPLDWALQRSGADGWEDWWSAVRTTHEPTRPLERLLKWRR